MIGHGHSNDVLVMTWSEFGRRVKQNAQQGTDHGSAGLMFLLGGQVKGGFYGAPPSLKTWTTATCASRRTSAVVYATVLERWLRRTSDGLLGKRFDQLDFLVDLIKFSTAGPDRPGRARQAYRLQIDSNADSNLDEH